MYVKEGIGRKLEVIRRWMEEKEEEVRTIIRGDLNARTREREGEISGEKGKEESEGRKSRDKKINAEGRLLLKRLHETGWVILNENTKKDKKGEWTYMGGRRKLVINYILEEARMKEEIERFEIRDKIDSDHQPVVVWVREAGKGKTRRKRKIEKRREIKGEKRRKIRWTEKGCQELRKKMQEVRRIEKKIKKEWKMKEKLE